MLSPAITRSLIDHYAADTAAARAAAAADRLRVLTGDHSTVPGAVRASCGISSTGADVDALLAAVRILAADADAGRPPPVPYDQDPRTGDFWPRTDRPGWSAHDRDSSMSCARG